MKNHHVLIGVGLYLAAGLATDLYNNSKTQTGMGWNGFSSTNPTTGAMLDLEVVLAWPVVLVSLLTKSSS